MFIKNNERIIWSITIVTADDKEIDNLFVCYESSIKRIANNKFPQFKRLWYSTKNILPNGKNYKQGYIQNLPNSI